MHHLGYETSKQRQTEITPRSPTRCLPESRRVREVPDMGPTRQTEPPPRDKSMTQIAAEAAQTLNFIYFSPFGERVRRPYLRAPPSKTGPPSKNSRKGACADLLLMRDLHKNEVSLQNSSCNSLYSNIRKTIILLRAPPQSGTALQNFLAKALVQLDVQQVKDFQSEFGN